MLNQKFISMTKSANQSEILHEDCLLGMKSVASDSVPLIIADPPYNLNKDFGVWKESEKKSEWLSWTKEWVAECVRVMKPGGAIFVYGIHRHLCWIQCFLYELGMEYQRQIIWHYENGFSGYTKTLAAHYEPILWFTKGKSFVYHDIREPYKSASRLKHKITKNGKVWTPNPAGRMAGDVWKFPVLAGKRFASERVDHPTQKPLSLSLRLVKHFSNEGDLVLVPFVGSGSECLAAAMSGRLYLGYDLNQEYIELARSRILAWENRRPSPGVPKELFAD